MKDEIFDWANTKTVNAPDRKGAKYNPGGEMTNPRLQHELDQHKYEGLKEELEKTQESRDYWYQKYMDIMAKYDELKSEYDADQRY